jgi:hypothetical protein
LELVGIGAGFFQKQISFATWELHAGLPDFQTKNPNMGQFWGALKLPYIFYGHLVYFVAIWYI